MHGSTHQVSFRLAAEHADELNRRAAARGVSRGDYARQSLIANLTGNPAEDTRNRVAELQDELQKLRQELWTSVAALLTHAGKVDPQAAKDWVARTLVK